MKKFFKYPVIGLVSLFLLTIIGIMIWWNSKSDSGKSNNFINVHNFETSIEHNQDNSNAWMERSAPINKSGDFEKGFEYLNKAVELDPTSHLGYRGWIRLRKLRDYDKALIDFNHLDSLTPNVVDAPWGEDIDFLRGECYFGKKDYKKAIELFNRNIKNQKEDWADIHTFVYLGLCEYEQGNYKKSVSEFQRALKQSEYVPESYFGIAKAYQKLGQIDLAKENLRKAENSMYYKRDDIYNEFLNEIYPSDLMEFRQKLNKK
ncbi:tetratricopeptide repeat protein [uncultured Eudoraea sp.]|uniref:tetratricopeptide repeat protein n=1 Tax=uncultured Eudoraea sp. TaxID=1035614 RepID=UPI002602425A|nr:tetratricopeptide repeat protein [uncultured Eudoraea sp.]